MREADQQGKLAGLPKNLTFWLRRANYIPDLTLDGVACNTNADCAAQPDDVCDLKTHRCSFGWGLGNGCQNMLYESGSAANGEWFAVYEDGAPTNVGGVHEGSLVYHFSRRRTFDPMVPQPCQDETVYACGGPCDALRAIACCGFDCNP